MPASNLILHGFQVHPDKTLAGCAAQDALIGVPATVMGCFWPMQQTQLGITRYLDFPIVLAAGLWGRGQLYMQTWSAMDLTAGVGWPLADLLAHKHDAYLHKQAALIKAFKHPVFIRLDHEFNWTRSPFYTPNGADFITLWRYIVDLFRADGATNATWVWCPNQVVIGEDLSKLYPGDSYVDWTAVDTYNWGNLVKWQTFAQIMDVSYGALLQVAPSKPIFLAETASDDRGGDKAAWITDWLLTMAVRYPSLRAFTYFPCVTGVEHWPMAAADIAAYVQGLKAGPYPLVGAYPMPPDLTPILPLQAASWGNQVAPLQAQGVLDRASIASLQSQVIVANTATGVANTATGVANAAAASTQATLDQAQADVAAVIKFGQPGPTVP